MMLISENVVRKELCREDEKGNFVKGSDGPNYKELGEPSRSDIFIARIQDLYELIIAKSRHYVAAPC